MFINLSDFLQLFIILEEEGQVHKWHIHIWVSSIFPVFLYSVFPPRECMLVDLCEQDSGYALGSQEFGAVLVSFFWFGKILF